MLIRFRNLLVAAATLCTASAFAAELTTVKVPFNFVAKNHAYEAGAYTVSVDWSRSMVTMNKIGTPGTSLTWIMLPAEETGHSKVSLTFDVAGQDHALRTIRYDKYATPNLDRQPKRAVEGTTTIGE